MSLTQSSLMPALDPVASLEWGSRHEFLVELDPSWHCEETGEVQNTWEAPRLLVKHRYFSPYFTYPVGGAPSAWHMLGTTRSGDSVRRGVQPGRCTCPTAVQVS